MRAFNDISWFEYCDSKKATVQKEILSNNKAYILSVNEQEYKAYLIEHFSLEPITILFEHEKIAEPSKQTQRVEDHFGRGYHEIEVYSFNYSVPFTGSGELFNVAPSQRGLVSYNINITNGSYVNLTFIVRRKTKEEFESMKKEALHGAFFNVKNINEDVKKWNAELPVFIESMFNKRKKEFLEENSFFESINLKVNKDSDAIFTVPTVKKRALPTLTKEEEKEFKSHPSIDSTTYKNIISLISEVGATMEKRPSIYKDKGEEALRDFITMFLESRYEGATTTTETFNKKGKTDILIKYKDGTNLFVAECKFWTGQKGMKETIDQLLSYLTWRDTKTAILMFVDAEGINEIVQKGIQSAKEHSCFKKEHGSNRKSTFSLEFSLPSDSNQPIYLELMFFHFPHIK